MRLLFVKVVVRDKDRKARPNILNKIRQRCLEGYQEVRWMKGDEQEYVVRG